MIDVTRKITYAELEDMEYYNKNYVKSDWEGKTPKDFMEFYNSNNIEIDVTTWIRLNRCSEDMVYKKAFSDSLCFIRDTLGELFFDKDNSMEWDADWESYFKMKQRSVLVDGTHMSKSILMPVQKILANGESDLIIRISDNFHGYQVSVASTKINFDIDFSKLFETHNVPNFMYGFKKENIFSSYDESGSHFSFYIGDKYKLYVVMYLLSEYWKNAREQEANNG